MEKGHGETYRKGKNKIKSLSVMLSVKPEQVVEAVEKLKEEHGVKDGIKNRLYHQLFTLKTENLPESGNPLCLWEEDLDLVQLRQFCTMLYEAGKGKRVLVCSGEEGQYRYVMGSNVCDMRERSKRMNSQINGKGGGTVKMAQGTFFASKEAIEKAWESGEDR